MTVQRVEDCFRDLAERGKTALIIYLCVGDPSVEDTKACALAAIEAGADMLELGVPFSDPTADGPVIAQASYRAIQNGGSLKAALDVARAVRGAGDTPVVLFTYYNPIMAFGDAELPAVAAEAGVDAFLVVDLPPEEGKALRAAAAEEQLGFVPLLAPTSDSDREARAFESASGFVYYVSLTGVTGADSVSLDEAGRRAAELQERAKLPVVVGFGIDTGAKAKLAANEGVAGVVVGTAAVRAIGSASDTVGRAAAVGKLVAGLRAGLDG